jgi:hypothetical protein
VQLLGRVGQYPKKGKGDVWRFPLATNTTYQSRDEFGGGILKALLIHQNKKSVCQWLQQAKACFICPQKTS